MREPSVVAGTNARGSRPSLPELPAQARYAERRRQADPFERRVLRLRRGPPTTNGSAGGKWHLENGYAAHKEKGRTILMHRQIMQPPKDMVVDHIDGNQANNCRFNLRVCTRAENQRNRRKHAGSISRFKGVFYNKQRRKWFSQCWLEGKCHATRYVDEEVEAARAYDRQAVEYFGEFARLNFPEEWPPERRQEVYAQRDAAKREDGEGEKVRRSEGEGRDKAERETSSCHGSRVTGHGPRRGPTQRRRDAKRPEDGRR